MAIMLLKYCLGGENHISQASGGVFHSGRLIAAMGRAVGAFGILAMTIVFPFGSLHQFFKRIRISFIQ